MRNKQIAIVGAGPSGAMCGLHLARAGFDVTLYDERGAWEKPCGGGLTHKAVVRYPFLLDPAHPKKLVYSVELISSGSVRARLELGHPIVIYSRAVLNGLLLEKAKEAGCRVVRSRVTRMETAGSRVQLTVGGAACQADFAVIAAGARNALLPETTPLGRAELEMTLGYFIPAKADHIKVKFLRRFEGYIWSFPRADHLSVGICGSMARHTSHELRGLLEQFLSDENISSEGARFYSHVLPCPETSTLRRRRICGRNWALAGDAAALVDPLTGEGLYYAMRSGELLAEAIAEECPEQYPARARADFAGDLEFAGQVARHAYRGRFLGGPVTTRTVQFIGRSAAFRALIADLFSGAQDYSSLKRRLWAEIGVTLREVAGSLLRPRTLPDKEPAGAG